MGDAAALLAALTAAAALSTRKLLCESIWLLLALVFVELVVLWLALYWPAAAAHFVEVISDDVRRRPVAMLN